MHVVANVILFVAENRHLFSDSAARVIANAFRLAEAENMGGIIPSADLPEVFGNESMAQGFNGMTSSDSRHTQIWTDHVRHKPTLDLALVLVALFGGVTQELRPFFVQEANLPSLPAKIGELVRAQGIYWKDGWIKLTTG